MRDWLRSEPGRRVLLVLGLCALPLVGFWLTGLYDLDEGFYGAVTREMLWRGDFITPYYMGVPWFEKPILLYWLSVPSVLAFGEMVGPRVPSVLATLGTVGMLITFAQQQRGERAGLISGYLYGTSLLVIAMGRLMTTDAILGLTMVWLFTSFWRSITESPRHRWGAAAALGLAVLAKGPVAGVFFILIAGITYWRCPDLRGGFKKNWLGPIVLGVAIIAAWYVPAYLANGDLFVQEFLIKQNLGRFQGGDKAHQLPWWSIPTFYPLTLVLSFGFGWYAAVRAGLLKRTDDSDLNRFLWIWFGVIFVFFSLSGSKLPHYILPAAAPLALLMGLRLSVSAEEKMQKWRVPAIAWAIFVAVLANAVLLSEDKRNADLHNVIKAVRSEPERIVAYPVGRTESKTDISLEFAERSHPSIFFYMRQPGAMLAAKSELAGQETPFILVTPKKKLEQVEKDIAEQGWRLEPLSSGVETKSWTAFRVQSR